MDNVYGHPSVKRALNALIKRSQEHYYNKCVLGRTEVQSPLKLLLIGPSGTGKTHLINSLRKQYDFPFLSLDATSLTPVGNNGGINSVQLKKMIYDVAHQELKKPQYHSAEGVISQMVIFVDEFDKLGNSWDASGTWNSHVQSNFLTLIDDKDEFAGISWIFAGAFSKLFENKKSNGIGFFKVAEGPKQLISDQDILNAGIIPELLGRISLVLQLDAFTEQDYLAILNNMLLPLYSGLPELSEETKINMARTAMNSGLGIRNLSRQLEHMSIEAQL